jgi:glycosyltransferase involved in cell wall biosynthesis
LTDRTVRAADHVFLLSEQAYSLIDPDVLGDHAELIPMAPPMLAPDSGVAPKHLPSRPFFIVAADLMPFKGIELIPPALAAIDAARRPDVLVCGRSVEPDYVRAVEAEAIRLGVQDYLRLLGTCPHDDVLALMRHARGCLVPSRFENLSRVPIEAMTTGTPVVASDVPSSREACGDAALYFDVEDTYGLGQQLLRVLEDDLLCRDLTAKGHARLAGAQATDASARILRALEACPSLD